MQKVNSRSRASPALPDYWATDVSLASMTTLRVGGPARYLAHCQSVEQLTESLCVAKANAWPVFVLGGGSNIVVADQGFDGVVVQLAGARIQSHADGEDTIVRASGGTVWDDLVAYTVGHGLGGIECLSRIPGSVGAAPVQNLWAYGQAVSEVIDSVEAIDRDSLETRTFAPSECGFGYRTSHFKKDWRNRYVVTAVSFRLRKAERGTVVYKGLRWLLPYGEQDSPSVAAVRQAVIDSRRNKAMVVDEANTDTHSAGSFFLNPILSSDEVARLESVAKQFTDRPLLKFPVLLTADDQAVGDQIKIPAAYLIEEGVCKPGLVRGNVGVSTRHSLALINRGGATATELIELADWVIERTQKVWGVTLEPEPQLVGFAR